MGRLQGESRWAAWGLWDLRNSLGMSSAEEVPVSAQGHACWVSHCGCRCTTGWRETPEEALFLYLLQVESGTRSRLGNRTWRLERSDVSVDQCGGLKHTTELLQEPVNTLNPKAYFANIDSWPTVPGGPWGPLLGAPSTGAELWGWEVSFLLWSRSTAELSGVQPNTQHQEMRPGHWQLGKRQRLCKWWPE